MADWQRNATARYLIHCSVVRPETIGAHQHGSDDVRTRGPARIGTRAAAALL